MKSELKRMIWISFLLILFLSGGAFAETKTFIKEYTYQASDEDSKNSSRIIALREVKRLLLEELGTYLESITEVKNFKLTKDQITSLTAGIVKTEIISEKWDGHTYWIKTRIVADENDVIKSIDSLRKDRDKSRELEDTRKRTDALLEENKKLREELALAKGNARQQIQQRYDKSIKELSAFEWLESGYKNHMQGDFAAAVADYSRAIELNPRFDLAYNNRGISYHMQGQYSEALTEYHKAIELNPRYADAYNNRGITYHVLGRYNEALVEYNTAIKLNPKYADAYLNRGMTYHALGRYHEALVEYNRSIELNPRNAYAYECRAMAYHALGRYHEERAEYNKANQLKLK